MNHQVQATDIASQKRKFPYLAPQFHTLPTINVGPGRLYLSFWREGISIDAHYLSDAPDWSQGYVECVGAECPACKAGYVKEHFYLIPALDRVRHQLVLLRVPPVRGPGTLATALDEILNHPEKGRLIARISGVNQQQHRVRILVTPKDDQSLLGAAKTFSWALDNQELDLTACVAKLSADEMAEHPHIGEALKLEALPDARILEGYKEHKPKGGDES